MVKVTAADFRKAAPKYKLVPHLERAIAAFDDEWGFQYEPKVGDNAWHPSSDCVPDPSTLYASAMARLHHDEHEDKISKKYGQVGHFWHQWLQYIVLHKLEFCPAWAVERRGMKEWSQGPFGWSTGAGDIAPCSIPNHGDYVVDFKTMSSQMFKQLTIPEYFAKKYEAQINIYMDFFDLDRGLILCVNKDTPHDFKEFEYRRNDDLIAAVYDKWKFVGECVANEDEPDEQADKQFSLEGLYESAGL